MTATEVTGQGRALPGRLARSLRGAGLSGAALAGAGAAGALVSLRAAYPRPPRAAPPEGWPPPRPVPQGRLTVAVVLGASGSVITDALGPYEVFARSPEFFVYTVSARPAAMLSGGLAVVPDYSLGDVDAGTAPEPAVVVIPAVVSPAGRKEQPLREWLTRRAGRGAHLLGVCAGSRLLAAAGLLDGHRATSHWSRLSGLQRSRPQVDWVRGQRYIQDGKITTTAGVTSGVFGALRLVQQLTSATEAQRVGHELAYPGWSLDGPTGIPAQRPAPRDLTNLLAALAPWRRPALGVGLVEGASEIDIAAPFEVYATSFAARTVPIAARPTVTTRHGLRLIAAPADATAPRVDRLIVPGIHRADQVDPRLAAWAAGRGLNLELPQADGEFSFDAMLRDLAAHADRATARVTAKSIEYPTGHLQLAGPAWPRRPATLLALTIAAAIGAAVLPAAAAGGTGDDTHTCAHAHPASGPVDTCTGSVGTGIRRHPGRVAARPPVARPGNRPGSPASPDRSGLHRVRSGRRKTQGDRRRVHHRWRVRLACRRGRHRVGLAPRPWLRRPWSQRLLAGAQPLRRRHTVVAAVLRRRRLARRRGSRHRDHCRSRISSLAMRQASGRPA